jgi:acetyl esterase/lipase
MSPFPTDLIPTLFDDPSTLRPTVERGITRYRNIRYAIELGWRPLYLDLVVPAGKGPVPVVVYIHGGAWMMNDNFPEPLGDLDFDEVLGQLTAAGFAVARVQYRLSAEAQFPAPLHDVKAAVRYLRTFSAQLGLDDSRIYAFGDSAGGHLASFLGVDPRSPELEGTRGATGVSSSVAAVVAWYPVTSMNDEVAQSRSDAMIDRTRADGPESLLIGADVNARPDLAAAASPISYVSASSAPVLLFHGDHDRIVPYGQSLVFRDAYERAGASVELVTATGADHCFVDGDVPPLVERTIAYLREQAF